MPFEYKTRVGGRFDSGKLKPIANDVGCWFYSWSGAPWAPAAEQEDMQEILILGRNPGINTLVSEMVRTLGYNCLVMTPETFLAGYPFAGKVIIVDEDHSLMATLLAERTDRPVILLANSIAPGNTSGLMLSKPFSISRLAAALEEAFRK